MPFISLPSHEFSFRACTPYSCLQAVRASILPQALASEILTKVAIKACHKELFGKYQIPSRFQLLSSALESTSNAAESCAALAVAAWCSIENLGTIADENDAVEGDSTAEHILLFPESAVTGMRIAVDGLSPIIKRLVQVYIECRQLSKESCRNAKREEHSVSHMIQNTLMSKILAAASSYAKESVRSEPGTNESAGSVKLSKLLHCAVWNQKRYEEELPAARVADVVREVLRSSAKAMKSNLDAHDDVFLHIIDELKIFLQGQKKRLGDVVDPELLQVLSSSFHVSFAAEFMDSRLLCFPRPTTWAVCRGPAEKQGWELLQISCVQLQAAEKLFAESIVNGNGGVHDACFFVQWAAIHFHLAILFEHTALAKLSTEDASISEETTCDQYLAKHKRSVLAKYVLSLSTCR